MSNPPTNSYRAFLNCLLSEARGKALWLLVQQLLTSTLQGFGLLLIIPLLSLAKVTASSTTESGLLGRIQNQAAQFGIDFQLSHILAVYVVAVILLSAFRHHHSHYAERLQQGFVARRGIELVRTLTQAPWIKLARARHSELTQTLSEDLKQIHLATMQSFQLFASITLFLINLIVAALVSLPLLLPSIAAIALLLLAFRPLHRRSQKRAQTYRRSREAYFDNVASLLDGLKLIKAHGAENEQIKAFQEISNHSVEESLAFRRAHASTQWVFDSVAVLGLALFVYAAATWLELSTASILLLVFLYARTLPQITRIQQCWQHIQHALPSFASYQNTLENFAPTPNPYPSSQALTPFTLQTALSLNNIRFAYPQHPERPILDKLTLTLPARQTTALMGPSGCGKSTLSDILCGLIEPDSGAILVDQRPLDPSNADAWQRQIAYVPQDNFLFHDTIRANLLWANPQASEADLWTALESANATDFVSQLPEKLDTIVGDRGSRLSGGERQRIALARALVRKPLLLILDEATNALDKASESQIANALEALHGELTILLITHDQQTATHADHIYRLANGAAQQLPTRNIPSNQT